MFEALASFFRWVSSLFVVGAAVSPETPTPTSAGPMPWLDRALSKVGEKEIPGSRHNPWIVSLFKWTTYSTNSDETPWCAAFVSWALDIKGNAAAKWFATYGMQINKPIPGAIVVLRHTTGSMAGRFHVTFCWNPIHFKSMQDFEFKSVGGNQSNAVTTRLYSNYDGYEIYAIRYPKGPR